MRFNRLIMIIGSVLILALFIFPMWNISIVAPQYPIPIGMDIWINGITDMNPNDIQNINILNHYIGMREIPTEIDEFFYFPIVVIFMSVLGLLFGFLGNYKLYLIWFIAMVVLGSIGIYDFYMWESDYGHNLADNAPLKILGPDGNPMTYQPPLFGTKPLLSFTAMSYPSIGAYFLFTGMIMSFVAYVMGKRASET